jgi:hypothetical protein
MPVSIAHNPVDRVVAALRDQHLSDGFTIPIEVIRDASEKFRLLATRIPVGSIQLQPSSQKDTAERRAAALLEYCCRQKRCGERSDSASPGSRRLTWAAVAAAVHAKSPAPLQQLQQILISFLQPVVLSTKGINRQVTTKVHIDKKTTCNISSHGISLRERLHPVKYKDSAVLTANDTTSDKSSGLRYVPRILPELVIRLAGHLVDPNGTQKLACQLLNDIYSYYDRPANFDASASSARAVDVSSYSNAAERRGHLYDLQRYSAAYEAAALYHVATNNMDHNQERLGCGTGKSVATGRMTKKKQKCRNNSKTGKDEALTTEDDDNDVLVSALADSNEGYLNSPDDELPIIRGLQIDDLVEASSEFTYLEVKQVLPRVQTLAKKLHDRAVGSTKLKEPPRLAGRSKTAADPLDADHISNQRKRMKTSDGEKSRKFDAASSLPSFAEWKESILTSIRSATQAPADASIDFILSMAADEVLRKHGIL